MAATYRDKARGHFTKLASIAALCGKAKPRKGPGPVRWCNRCSRFHGSRQICDLYMRTRILDNGKEVKRWAH